MKLALLIDDYLPDSTRVAAKMFHELAVYFQQQGHQVTVITPGFNQHNLLSISSLDNITIWRFSSGEIKGVGKVKRAINETLLSVKAWLAISSKIKEDDFDGVIYYSPSIFWGGLVKFISSRCQCPTYLVLRDLFPDWAIDAGMIRDKSLITRYFRYFEKMTYQQANMIGLMSVNNVDAFRRSGNGYPCQVLPNWASLKPVDEFPISYVPIRHSLNLQDKIIFFYGGNIGHAQDMANLMRLTKSMSVYNNAHFLYVGQGDEVELITELATQWDLTNFTYLPSISQERFKLLLAEIDVGLFSLSANHTCHNFPGKLLGYMVQNIPILGSVNQGNDLMDVINENEAGVVFLNGEDDCLHNAAVTMLQDPDYRQRLGVNASQLLQREFSVNAAAELILESLSS